MFVACSTLCFATEPLETALLQIAELEFDKFELALAEDGGHIRPREACDHPELAIQRLRQGPALIPASIHVDLGRDLAASLTWKQFEGLCRLAKLLSVAVLTLPASGAETPIDEEVKRLTSLASYAQREGLVLALLTHRETLTAQPQTAVELCQAVPGLGLTLDPSHFLQGPHPTADFDMVFPYVQNVHLRDTGSAPGEFQVRVGQGRVDYARVVTQLQRYGYNRSLTVAIVDRPDNPFEREVEIRKLKLLLETLI